MFNPFRSLLLIFLMPSPACLFTGAVEPGEVAPQDMARDLATAAEMCAESVAQVCAQRCGEALVCGDVVVCGGCAMGERCEQGSCVCELPGEPPQCTDGEQEGRCGTITYANGCGEQVSLRCEQACPQGMRCGEQSQRCEQLTVCSQGACEAQELSCGRPTACEDAQFTCRSVCAGAQECVANACVSCASTSEAEACGEESEGGMNHRCATNYVRGCGEQGSDVVECAAARQCGGVACEVATHCSEVLLRNPTALGQDAFGAALLIEGDILLVGAPGAQGGRGAVYLYDLSTPSPTLRDIRHGEPEHAGFGSSLAALPSTSRVLVGAPGSDDVVMLEVEAQRFLPEPLLRYTAPAGNTGGQFGASLAVHPGGEFFVVGAPEYMHVLDGERVSTGAAFVFDMKTTQLLGKLPPFAPELKGGHIGRALTVALAGGEAFVLVGAPSISTRGDRGGRVLVFHETPGMGWAPYDGGEGALPGAHYVEARPGAYSFGTSLATTTSEVYVGAPHSDTSHVSALRFDSTLRRWSAGLAADQSSSQDHRIGASLSAHEDVVVFGGAQKPGSESKALLLLPTTRAELYPSRSSSLSQKEASFGEAVAISQDWVAVAAPGHVFLDDPIGAVYIYPAPGR